MLNSPISTFGIRTFNSSNKLKERTTKNVKINLPYLTARLNEQMCEDMSTCKSLCMSKLISRTYEKCLDIVLESIK